MDVPSMDVAAERIVGATRIAAVRGDITALEVDAIVNAANEELAHGGGVAAAISHAGGPEVQRESDAWVRAKGPVENGAAAVTTAGAMPASIVIHVVGPRYRTGQDNPGMLRSAVTAALNSARAHDAPMVALPAISAGIFGYPPVEATGVIAAAVVEWVEDHDDLTEVLLVGFDDAMARRFADALMAVNF